MRLRTLTTVTTQTTIVQYWVSELFPHVANGRFSSAKWCIWSEDSIVSVGECSELQAGKETVGVCYCLPSCGSFHSCADHTKSPSEAPQTESFQWNLMTYCQILYGNRVQPTAHAQSGLLTPFIWFRTFPFVFVHTEMLNCLNRHALARKMKYEPMNCWNTLRWTSKRVPTVEQKHSQAPLGTSAQRRSVFPRSHLILIYFEQKVSTMLGEGVGEGTKCRSRRDGKKKSKTVSKTGSKPENQYKRGNPKAGSTRTQSEVKNREIQNIKTKNKNWDWENARLINRRL